MDAYKILHALFNLLLINLYSRKFRGGQNILVSYVFRNSVKRDNYKMQKKNKVRVF